MIGQAGGRCTRDSLRLVYPREIVAHNESQPSRHGSLLLLENPFFTLVERRIPIHVVRF